MCDANEPLLFQDQFLSGDSRTNENPGLQAMHTMWFREHNRLADLVATADPSLDDEAIFQGRQSQEFSAPHIVAYPKLDPSPEYGP